MTSNFEKEFGFRVNNAEMPETAVESKDVPIAKLVDGFSWSNSCQSAVTEAASKLGCDAASTLVVFHNFKYDPSEVKVKPSTKLVFVGAFPFS